MTGSELAARFWEQTAEDGIELDDFLRRLQAGQYPYGPATPAVVQQFLDIVYQEMVRNLETKLEEMPAWQVERDDALEFLRLHFEALRRQYAPGPPHSGP
ncbi:MAG: hypothetical protein IMX01_01690 [Limnochordaceae bacterium]|nr:hypothetical protein [Limnochordaceae bacterium]